MSVADRYRQRAGKRRSQAPGLFVATGGIAFLLLAVWLMTRDVKFQSAKKREEKSGRVETTRYEAAAIARKAVKQFVKWPHTTVFEVENSQQLGRQYYEVAGVFTSESDLSLKHRMRYACRLSYWKSTDEWKVVYLQLDGKVLFDEPENQARYLVYEEQ